MVNEINRPSTETAENEALRVRMEASNRNIERMQHEHQDLLREMATLRQTAAELAANNAQQTARTSNTTAHSINTEAELVDKAEEAATSHNVSTASVLAETSETKAEINAKVNNSHDSTEITTETANSSANTDDSESAASSDYIREKIAEIAAMKAQFKRVRHMVNTTNMIEDHVARDPLKQLPARAAAIDTPLQPITTETAEEDAEIDSSLTALGTERRSFAGVDKTRENVELLMDLLSVFDDFKSDLREQASSLRAERDRLRALKEEILRRRNQS